MTRYLGDYVSARALAEEAVAMFRELGEKEGLGYSISNLGSIAHGQGGYAFAVPLHEESLAVFTQSANQRGMAHAKMKLGLVAYLQEDYASSLSLHRESLELRKGSGNKHIVAFSLAHLGAVAVAIGQVREGVRLLGAATAILEATGVFQEPDDRVPYEAGLALARAHLGEDEFATLLAEGRNMTIEEAIDHALNL